MTGAAEEFVFGLLGKPYRLGSQGPDAFDCFGLFREVQATLFDRHIEAVERPAREELFPMAIEKSKERRRWRKIAAPVHGAAVVLANVFENKRHLGTFLEFERPGRILHTDEKTGVVFERIAMVQSRGFTRLEFFERK